LERRDKGQLDKKTRRFFSNLVSDRVGAAPIFLRCTAGSQQQESDQPESLKLSRMDLQKQKQEYEARQIIDAYRKSGKTFEELMTFLNV